MVYGLSQARAFIIIGYDTVVSTTFGSAQSSLSRISKKAIKREESTTAERAKSSPTTSLTIVEEKIKYFIGVCPNGKALGLGACSGFRLRFSEKRAIGRKTAETRANRDRAAEKIVA